MALALPIDESWPSPPEVEAARVPSGLNRTPEAELRAILAKFGRDVSAFEDYVRETEDSRKRLIQSAERRLEIAKATSKREDLADDLEASIEDFRAMETSLAGTWLPEIRRMEVRRKEALRSKHMLQRGPFADLLRRRADAMVTALKRIRDVRLELAAIAAELEESADGPVLADPNDLKKYLETV